MKIQIMEIKFCWYTLINDETISASVLLLPPFQVIKLLGFKSNSVQVLGEDNVTEYYVVLIEVESCS